MKLEINHKLQPPILSINHRICFIYTLKIHFNSIWFLHSAEYFWRLMRKLQSVMMIHRNCLPTPIMPPILVRRVSGPMFSWDLVSTTSRSMFMNIPYLSDRESNPVLAVLYQMDLHDGKQPLFSLLSLINDDRNKSTLSALSVDKLRSFVHQRLGSVVIHGGAQLIIDRILSKYVDFKHWKYIIVGVKFF